jgi:L-lactate dehydrogenase complex protein LldG
MSARDNILDRVRQALGREPGKDALHEAAVREKIAQRLRGPLPQMPWDPVERFISCCEVLSSTVDQLSALEHVPEAVAAYMRRHDLSPELVCWPALANLPWAQSGIKAQARVPTGEDKVGVTGCFCAIAETGTLMMHSGISTPMTTSLLPDSHIAVVRRQQLVMCMEDAWDRLRHEIGDLPRQVAFVSGPSRTADIEMTMVLGIHGPYRVHILLVDE